MQSKADCLHVSLLNANVYLFRKRKGASPLSSRTLSSIVWRCSGVKAGGTCLRCSRFREIMNQTWKQHSTKLHSTRAKYRVGWLNGDAPLYRVYSNSVQERGVTTLKGMMIAWANAASNSEGAAGLRTSGDA
jgi:hypothetical protein